MMKNIILLIFAILVGVCSQAQNVVKNVIVETYYISDVNDATDTTAGNYLEAGSKTYRIYVQLKPGYKLTKLYGDKNHPLSIRSTSIFFNNRDYGKSVGKDINQVSLNHNTVGLDTWLTIGQTTKTHLGVLKSNDTNGSLIDADGGSAEIPGGLLKNDDPLAGTSLSIADGMDTLINPPANWVISGITDIISGEDSTIFGSIREGSEFVSDDVSIQNTGIMGVNPDSNQVLISQLTTKGEISFELNIEVTDSIGNIIRYVSNGLDSIGEIGCPYLRFPPDSGCIDPNYMEFTTKYIRNDNDSCKTPIIYGCMDPNACNYDSDATFNLESLCCYPGKCSGRDLSLVCPDMVSQPMNVEAYPNPASDELTIKVTSIDNKETEYVIINTFGKLVYKKELGVVSDTFTDIVKVSDLQVGVYMIRVIAGDSGANRVFIKD